MAWNALFSDRRPLKVSLLMAASLALLLAAPLSMHTRWLFGAGGVFSVEVANGRIELQSPSYSTSAFEVRVGGFDDSTVASSSRYLLPHAHWYQDFLSVDMPSWLLMCIAFAFYRRARRRYEAEMARADWCRACYHDLPADSATQCAKCSHDASLTKRVGIMRWIATGLRKDLIFGKATGCLPIRVVLAMLFFVMGVMGIGDLIDKFVWLRDGMELFDNHYPTMGLFTELLAFACLAFLIARIALVVLFVERPFAAACAKQS